jgi:hypothetical protein
MICKSCGAETSVGFDGEYLSYCKNCQSQVRDSQSNNMYIKKALYHCTTCSKTTDSPQSRGFGWIEVILWLLYIIPGLVYSIWRRSGIGVCPNCEKDSLIPDEENNHRYFIHSNEKIASPDYKIKGSSKKAMIMWPIGILILFILLSTSEQKASKVWSPGDKVKLCKSYIGTLFQKPVSSISHYNTDGNNIYVSYFIEQYDEQWKYVCNIEDKEMYWAGWLADTNKWGRWRYEDSVKLKYNNNYVKFRVVDTNELITVKL